MRRLFVLFLLLLAAPATAQRSEPEWRQAVEHQILVRLGAYEPNEIRLEAGRPARLVFYNNSRAPLSLQAGSFFANSYIRSGDARLLSNGGLVLAPGETRAVTLVPSEGRYRIRSRSWFRRVLGMSALIIVERPGTQQRSQGRSQD
jgi:hypothetical protein